MILRLRSVRLRRGRFLALPPDAAATPVPYRLEVLRENAPPFLAPVRSPRAGGPGRCGLLLDASGLLPVARRFARPARSRALRARDRAEAEAALAGVDAALAQAADLLLPADGFDLSPESVFLAYREGEWAAGDGASPASPAASAPRAFDVRLACLPCRLGDDAFAGRDDLERWLAGRRLVERKRSARPVASKPTPVAASDAAPPLPAAPPSTPAARARLRPRDLRATLPWAVPLAEASLLAGGLALQLAGVSAAMPVLLVLLGAVDAALLLHPRSPLCVRAPRAPGAGADGGMSGDAPGARPGDPRRRPAARPSDRTVPLSTPGQVSRLGILSEHEPGTFEEAEGRRWFVLVDEFTVGRDAERADLVPDAPGVSRLHARIRRLGDVFTVEDLSARNGTFLDDRRLDPGEERVLPERCTLRFAAAKYWFRVE